MRFFSNSKQDNPTLTADERAREVLERVIAANEDLNKRDKINFSYNPTFDCIAINRRCLSNYNHAEEFMRVFDTKFDSEKQYNKLLTVLAKWVEDAKVNDIMNSLDELSGKEQI